MNSNLQANELSIVYNEYKTFFPKCELKLVKRTKQNLIFSGSSDDYYSKILSKKQQINESHVFLKTQEGEALKISVDLSGWYEIPDMKSNESATRTHYETFETLMMVKSQSFQNQFSSEVSRKLNSQLADRSFND